MALRNMTETAPPTAAEVTLAQAEFLDFKGLRTAFSIPKSTAYRLEAEGEIEFVRLRRKGKQAGRTLVNVASVRSFFTRCKEADSSTNGRNDPETTPGANSTTQ